MLALPMSCSQPPSRQRCTASGGEPELDRGRRGQLGDLLAVQLGHALARAGEQREALRDAHDLGLGVLQVALREVADEAEAIPSAALGGVQRAVGGSQQRVAGREARASLGRTDRDGDRDPDAGDDQRRVADGRAHLLAELAQADLLPHSTDQHGELLPAEARDESALADDRRDPAAELDQHLVAGLVSVRVVDALEPVDVEQQHAGADRAVRPRQTRVERRAEPCAVGEAGQRIRRRLTLGLCERDLELVGHPTAIGDVRQDADQQQPSVGVAVREDAGPDAAHDAIHADHPVLGLGRLARVHVRQVLSHLRLVVLVYRGAPAREHVGPRRTRRAAARCRG